MSRNVKTNKMAKRKQKTKKMPKGIVAGDVVECINAKPVKGSRFRRIALKQGSKYLVFASVKDGTDKSGKIKNAVLVGEVSGAEIKQLKYPYFWDAKRFSKIKSGYFQASDRASFLRDDVFDVEVDEYF